MNGIPIRECRRARQARAAGRRRYDRARLRPFPSYSWPLASDVGAAAQPQRPDRASATLRARAGPGCRGGQAFCNRCAPGRLTGGWPQGPQHPRKGTRVAGDAETADLRTKRPKYLRPPVTGASRDRWICRLLQSGPVRARAHSHNARMHIEAVSLRGSHVHLEPYAPAVLERLCDAALAAPEIFRFIPVRMLTRDDLIARFAPATGLMERRVGVVWVTRNALTAQILGSTSMLITDATHRRVEIGFTWLLPEAQRTAANTEAKYLQLRHAFEVAGMMRVEFKTDARNLRSRAALARIGAVEEGTLRAHMLCWDGHRRDSVYFSIIDTEWSEVKAKLEARLYGT